MPRRTHVDELIDRYPLISDQIDIKELRVILSELSKYLEKGEVQGAVVEFGCYIGTTSLFIRRLLDTYGSRAEFHVYDSFSGLPDKTTQDLSPAGEQFRTGELAVSRKDFEMQFRKAGLKVPTIHKGWFADLGPGDIPHQIGFAYLDGDYYDSIKDSLHLLSSQLIKPATIIVDDYANEALPGAARAVNEWLRTHPAKLRVEASLAVISLVS